MVKKYLDVAHPTGPLYPRNPLIKLFIYMWGLKATNVGLNEKLYVVTFFRLIDEKTLVLRASHITPHWAL